jgi:plasmid stability protein
MLGAMSSEQTKPYSLRMPDELRDELTARANEAGRSLNAEIVARLQGTIEQPPAPPDLEAFADKVAEKVAAKLKGKS